jgi:hypothetical protein
VAAAGARVRVVMPAVARVEDFPAMEVAVRVEAAVVVARGAAVATAQGQ